MKKLMILAVLFYLSAQNAYAECQSFANPEVMNTIFMEHLDLKTNQKSNRIAVLPFVDLSPTDADPLLAKLVGYALYDLFAPLQKNWLHPYVSFLKSGESASSDPKVLRQLAADLKAQYLIHGSYQMQNGTHVRFSIGIYNRTKDQFLSPQQSFTVPLDDSLIDLLDKNMRTAFKNAKLPVGSRNQHQLPALKSYRYYTKGLDHAKTYEAGALTLAGVWLEKALRESHHHFDEATLALARSRFMLALLQKLSHQHFAETFQSGQTILTHLKDKSASPQYLFTNRFLKANESYQKSLAHLSARQFKDAGHWAANGLSFVPEDGMLENIVALAESNQKGKPAVTLRQPVCF